MEMKQKSWPWALLALAIVLATLYYQRATGPTYEKSVGITLDGTSYTFELPRSHEKGTPCLIPLRVTDSTVSATLFYRRYPTNDAFRAAPFSRTGDTLSAMLPEQPAAGKLAYYFMLSDGDSQVEAPGENPVVVRFKGAVPTPVLASHIMFMFVGLWLSTWSGLLALRKHPLAWRMALGTLVVLFIGGLVLGPIVQKYAFDAFWTGVPFGWDLTDNKTLLAVVVWAIAIVANLKQRRNSFFVAAAAIMILVFAIPHSTMGSEYDYEKGEVITGE